MTLRELIHPGRASNVPVRQRHRLGQSLMSLQDDMDRLFQEFFNGTNLPAWGHEPDFPAVDIVENDKTFKVKAELAGMSPEDVEVNVTDGFLTIEGEKQEEKEEKDDNYLRRETSYGSFKRTIALPETADCAGAQANFKNGVLSIDVPKKAEAVMKPKKLQIKKAA